MKNLQNTVLEMIDNNQYEEAAQYVAKVLNIEFKVSFLDQPFYFHDTKKRDVYEIMLSKGSRKYTFKYGNSIANTGKYIGHKQLCLSEFGQFLFSQKEYDKIGKWERKNNEIVLNKNYKEPSLYDILACLQKYDVGTFEDFCAEFGYDEDSRRAEGIYEDVQDEYTAMQTLFTDEELEVLQEIN